MRASLIFMSVLLLALPGCSFRPFGPSQGRVETLAVSPWGKGEPTILTASVSFPGERVEPVLAIETDEAAGVIRVRGYGTQPSPPFGWGVFRALQNTPRTYEAKGAVYLPRAGAWRVEALSGAEVTATASFAVE